MDKRILWLILLVVGSAFALALDSDGDSIVDEADRYPFDFDNDGLPDAWEHEHGTRFDIGDANNDPDQDGLSNREEFTYSTDPHTADTDGDGIIDTEEIEAGSDPLDPSSPKVTLSGAGLWMLIISIIIGVVIAVVFRKPIHDVLKPYYEKLLAKYPFLLRLDQKVRALVQKSDMFIYKLFKKKPRIQKVPPPAQQRLRPYQQPTRPPQKRQRQVRQTYQATRTQLTTGKGVTSLPKTVTDKLSRIKAPLPRTPREKPAPAKGFMSLDDLKAKKKKKKKSLFDALPRRK